MAARIQRSNSFDIICDGKRSHDPLEAKLDVVDSVRF
uniref:Uncharacterized protein n=1 Tax=Siphoviridae sp. ctZHD14 TaxID=2827891 RepID=A0A8S5SXN1_9CAUD|nr:MAG TPA: hypothetical protein [Siphoviridae sp. ctZHD14]